MKRFVFLFVAVAMALALSFGGSWAAEESEASKVKIIPLEKSDTSQNSVFGDTQITSPPIKQSEETKKVLDNISVAMKDLLTSDAKGSFTLSFRMGMIIAKVFHKEGKNRFFLMNKFGYPFVNVYQNSVQFYSPTKNEIKEFNKNTLSILEYKLRTENKKEDSKDNENKDKQKQDDDEAKHSFRCDIVYKKEEQPEYAVNVALSEIISDLKNFTGKIIIKSDKDSGNLRIEAHRRIGGILMKIEVDKKTNLVALFKMYKNDFSYIAIEDIKYNVDVPDSVFEVDTDTISKYAITYNKNLSINNALEFSELVTKGATLAAIDSRDAKLTIDDVKKLEADVEASTTFAKTFELKYVAFNKNVVDLKLEDEEKFLNYMKEMETFIDGETSTPETDRNKAKAVLYYNLSQFYATNKQFKPSMRAINKSIDLDPASAEFYKEFKGKALFYEKLENKEFGVPKKAGEPKQEETKVNENK